MTQLGRSSVHRGVMQPVNITSQGLRIQSSRGKMTDHFAFQSSRKTLILGFRIILKESFLCVFEPRCGLKKPIHPNSETQMNSLGVSHWAEGHFDAKIGLNSYLIRKPTNFGFGPSKCYPLPRYGFELEILWYWMSLWLTRGVVWAVFGAE